MLFLTTATVATGISAITTAVGSVITSALTWVTSFAGGIANDTTGVIIVPFAMGLCLFGIHVLKSLMGR